MSAPQGAPAGYVPVSSVADLGVAIRAARKAQGMQLEVFAQRAGVSKQFVADVEHGKPTVQLERVLRLCGLLGVVLGVCVPSDAATQLEVLRQQGVKPHRPRGPQGQSEQRHVTGRWWRHDGQKFKEDPQPQRIPARVTPRTVLVELPDGQRHSLRRFDKEGGERVQWRIGPPAPNTASESFLVITL